jgi:NAD(P)-dependent dehydrogenase (short-subunit alcohol dehydrogenase family)
MERIEGRTALVTGAASGIGLAIAEALLAAGARVALVDWDAVALQRESARLGDATVAHRLDVTDRAGWADVAAEVEGAFGPVEILVNNAGIAPDLNDLADMPPESFDRLVAIKLTGTFNGIHTFAAGMRARGDGHIVNTASMAGLMASAHLGAYTAAKFGVVGLSEVLRVELESHGVGVSVLCPGMVRTNLAVNTPAANRPPDMPTGMESGIDPALVGAQVVEAIRANELYIITHGEYGRFVADRTDRLQRAFAAAPVRTAPAAEALPGTSVAKS